MAALMIAHLDLDAFFASVEQRDNPSLRGKPVVVGFATPQGNYCNRGVVSAASYEARAYGVHSGMSLWEAKRRCPRLIIIGGNFAKYQEASDKMYHIISRYSPAIEPLSLDEVFISFYECRDLYQDLLTVCQKMKREIKSEIGITASIGLASNKLVAKVASDFQKPDGLTLVGPGYEREFLAPLPCVKLYGIGPATTAKLARLGIKTVGELARVDRWVLVSIFGKYGEPLWYSANGLGSTKIAPPRPAKSVSRSTTFPVDSRDYDYLVKNLVYLSEKVVATILAEQVEGYCLILTLRDKDFKTWSHQRVLRTAISTADQILYFAKKLLLEAWNQITPLRLLGITISHLAPVSSQLSLLGSKDLQEATFEIRKKFGFWSIRPASILNLTLINKSSP